LMLRSHSCPRWRITKDSRRRAVLRETSRTISPLGSEKPNHCGKFNAAHASFDNCSDVVRRCTPHDVK
jgi:hypothetical protein